MEYSDNPRKIYVKIKIVYSDSDISKEIAVETSGNGEISLPEQTYLGYIAPTIKACTMDGNATMGGGYQMNGLGLITGWWSDVHSNAQNVFTTPPWLKISFTARPVTTWTVIGDSKLGQYPVDFTLTAYQGQSVYGVTEVINNTEITRRIVFADAMPDITAIKLTITKWSAPNAKAKILQFFDILEEEYKGEDLMDFEVLEELSGSSDGIGYGINSDTASFTIYNRERKFDKGYLRSLLLLNRKVVPYIGIEKADGIEYTKLGTFFSDEWTVPQTDQFVKLKCVDRLMSLQTKTYIGFPYTVGTNLYEIAEDILTEAGFSPEEYVIDESLRQDTLYSGFLRKYSCWDALQEVCHGGLCYAYCDRDDRIVLAKDKAVVTDIQVLPNSITKYERQTKNTDFSNYIEVEYSEVTTSSELVTVAENPIAIMPGAKLAMVLDYSSDISDAQLSFTPSANIEILSFESGVNAGRFEVRNTSGSGITCTATVKGYSLTVNSQTVITKDDDSIERWGKQEYKYGGSELIQSYAKAVEIGEALMDALSQNSGKLNIVWRGDPQLKLQDIFYAEDRFGDGAEYVTEFNRFKFDGGLKQKTTGRLLNDAMARTEE